MLVSMRSPALGWTPETLSESVGIFLGSSRSLAGRGRRQGRHGRQGWMIKRPLATRRLVQTFGILAEAAAIHPLIFHQAAHIRARLRDGNAFDKEQRIVLARLRLHPSHCPAGAS